MRRAPRFRGGDEQYAARRPVHRRDPLVMALMNFGMFARSGAGTCGRPLTRATRSPTIVEPLTVMFADPVFFDAERGEFGRRRDRSPFDVRRSSRSVV
jgi:hypothetical protein